MPDQVLESRGMFAISSGVMSDEDIQATVSAITTGTPYNIGYRVGATGEWNMVQNTVPYTAGTYIQYNQYTGTTWQLTDLTSSEYINLYVVAIPSIVANRQLIVIPGQVKYTNQANAEAAKLADDLDWGTLPVMEFCIVHRLTMRTGSSYTTTGKARIESIKDLRGKATRIQVLSGSV